MRGLASPATTVTVAGAYVAADSGNVKTDPKTVVGDTKCVECHKAEHAQWMKTVHYTDHKRLTSPNAIKIRQDPGHCGSGHRDEFDVRQLPRDAAG